MVVIALDWGTNLVTGIKQPYSYSLQYIENPLRYQTNWFSTETKSVTRSLDRISMFSFDISRLSNTLFECIYRTSNESCEIYHYMLEAFINKFVQIHPQISLQY